jgi:hypothetical protein
MAAQTAQLVINNASWLYTIPLAKLKEPPLAAHAVAGLFQVEQTGLHLKCGEAVATALVVVVVQANIEAHPLAHTVRKHITLV